MRISLWLHSDDGATAYARLFCRTIGLFGGRIGLICAFLSPRSALVMILQSTFKGLARNARENHSAQEKLGHLVLIFAECSFAHELGLLVLISRSTVKMTIVWLLQ